MLRKIKYILFVTLITFQSPAAFASTAGAACSISGAVERDGGQTLICNGTTWVLVSNIQTSGNFGVGEASPTAQFQVNVTDYSKTALLVVAPSSGSTIADFRSGNNRKLFINNNGTVVIGANNTLGAAFSLDSSVNGNGSDYGANAYGINNAATLSPTSATSAIGIRLKNTINTSSGNITNAYGLYASDPIKTGTNTINTAYGLYVENPTVATNNYSAYFAGAVGIGTTSPTTILDIRAAPQILNLSSTPGTAKGGLHIAPNSVVSNGLSNAITFGGIGASSFNDAQAGIYVQSSDTYGTKMHFGTTNNYTTGSQTRMIIDQVGNVGIGTTSPTEKLQVDKTGKIRIGDTVSDDGKPYVDISPNEFTVVGNGFTNGGNFIMDIGSGTTSGRHSMIIRGSLDNAISLGQPALINLYNKNQAGATQNGEYLRLDGASNRVDLVVKATGNVGIGTSSPQSTLHVPDNKYAQFEDNNAGAPPSGDCDADNERGRLSIDTSNNRLYICNGATRGWDYIALTD